MGSNKRIVVLANGVFDVLHYGHLLHLEEAAKMGDELVVSVTMDAFVNKGPHQPVFTQWQRQHMMKALRCVSDAIIVRDAFDALQMVMPTIFVKGAEYRGKLQPTDEAFCLKNNIQMAFTDLPTYSSTNLLHYYDRLANN